MYPERSPHIKRRLSSAHYLEKQLATIHESPLVVMAIGIPGSGKSTVLSEVSRDLDIPRISSDDIREELSGDAADQTNMQEVWDAVRYRIENHLADGRSVILDATNTEGFRRPDAIAQYREWGARAVAAALFTTPFHIASKRNRNRNRRVPEHALQRMSRQLQSQPVSLSEGFDRIIRIRT